MPTFYADIEPPTHGIGSMAPPMARSTSPSITPPSSILNASIWSTVTNGTSADESLSFNQQRNNSTSTAMQQLAYELSLFNFNQQQQQAASFETGSAAGSYSSDSGYPDHHSFANVPSSDATAAALMAAATGNLDTESQLALLARRRSQNTTECVPVPSSEHVAEIVGRQGCKIKALRAKTNTYIKTPVRGEEPVFVVTGRRDDVEAAKREILSAAEHFTQIRASRRHSQGGIPAPGHVTAYVRVPYKVVGLVVGPKGATIKRIQQQTHTYIITPSREKDPTFEVTGLPDNVETARKEIETHIANRTGAYPSTTVDPSEAYNNDHRDTRQQNETLLHDFHLNGVDTAYNSTTTMASLMSGNNPILDENSGGLHDSFSAICPPMSAPPYFSPDRRATMCANNLLPSSIEQRRASAETYFFGSNNNNNNMINGNNENSMLVSQPFNGWCNAFMGGGAKTNGIPIQNKAKKFNLAHSNSGSDQDEGVWSVGGESPTGAGNAEPLVSSCLASIWSEVVGV